MSRVCQLWSSGKQDRFKINMNPTGDKNPPRAQRVQKPFAFISFQGGKRDLFDTEGTRWGWSECPGFPWGHEVHFARHTLKMQLSPRNHWSGPGFYPKTRVVMEMPKPQWRWSLGTAQVSRCSSLGRTVLVMLLFSASTLMIPALYLPKIPLKFIIVSPPWSACGKRVSLQFFFLPGLHFLSSWKAAQSSIWDFYPRFFPRLQ